MPTPEASEDAMQVSQGIWYDRFHGKAKSPGWIIIAYAEALDAFALRRVADKDAEIAGLKQAVWDLNLLLETRGDEIAALRAQVEWRPISEAPKDGTRTDLRLRDGRRLTDCQWLTKPGLVGWFIPSGGFAMRIIHDHNAPTHWMRPPAPPDHTIPSTDDPQ